MSIFRADFEGDAELIVKKHEQSWIWSRSVWFSCVS